MTLLIISLLIFGAATTLAFVLTTGIGDLQSQTTNDFEEKRVWSEDTRIIKTFYPIITLLKPLVNLIYVPRFVSDYYGRLIKSAGLDLNLRVEDVVGLQIVMAVLIGFMARYWFEGSFAVLCGILIGIFFPVLWLKDTARKRQEEIMLRLPAVVDMISLSVAGGQEFNMAVRRIIAQAPDEKDPLIDELKIYMQNIRLGKTRTEALSELSERVNTSEIYSFCNVLIQADEMGANISETLRTQSTRLRDERFMNAEKAGAIASQKIMIPMMVFIFPLIFAVILTPYILKYLF